MFDWQPDWFICLYAYTVFWVIRLVNSPGRDYRWWLTGEAKGVFFFFWLVHMLKYSPTHMGDSIAFAPIPPVYMLHGMYFFLAALSIGIIIIGLRI